jgi:hypothetical protein
MRITDHQAGLGLWIEFACGMDFWCEFAVITSELAQSMNSSLIQYLDAIGILSRFSMTMQHVKWHFVLY